MDALRENRALRTTEVREGMPSVVWVVMVSGALITVGFTYLFAMRSFKLHAVATGALTVVVILLLFTVGVLRPRLRRGRAGGAWSVRASAKSRFGKAEGWDDLVRFYV